MQFLTSSFLDELTQIFIITLPPPTSPWDLFGMLENNFELKFFIISYLKTPWISHDVLV